VLSTADQSLTLQFPPGAVPDFLNLSLSAVDPSVAAANLEVNGQFYALSVLDNTGTPVTSFVQPFTLLITPPVGSDPSTLAVSALDPASGALVALQTQVTDDGHVLALVSALGAPANLQPAPPPSTDAAPSAPVEAPALAPDGGGDVPTDDALPADTPVDPPLQQASE
jgi:hypothetical protein